MGSFFSSISDFFSKGGGKPTASSATSATGGGDDGKQSSLVDDILTGASIALPLVGSGISLLGGLGQGGSDKKFAKFQKRQAQADAVAQLGLAKLQAKQIRKNAKQSVKGIANQTANAGVVVGSGADDDATKEALEKGFYDANITMSNANDAFLRALQQINYDSIVAKQQSKSSGIGNLTSMLSFAGAGVGAVSKWKKAFGEGGEKSTQTDPLKIAGTNSTSISATAQGAK